MEGLPDKPTSDDRKKLKIQIGDKNKEYGWINLENDSLLSLTDEEGEIEYEFKYNKNIGVLYVTSGPAGKKCIRCNGSGREPNR